MVIDKLKKSSPQLQLCPCGKANRSVLDRVPRGRFVKTLLFFLPIKKYKCHRCMRNRWEMG